MEIKSYEENYRNQVIGIWKSVFGYKDARNDPGFAIDRKIEVNDGLFFIALDNEIVAGTIMAGYDGHRGWIYSLAVLPQYRKQKIGTALLKYAENELKSLGCCKINLQVMKSNESVKQFYLKNGYNVEERICMGKEILENVR